MKRTPLKRAGMARSGAVRAPAGLKRRARATGPDSATRALVTARSEGRCERCGAVQHWAGFSIHHRIPRGRSGGNSAANLILLCGSGVTGCHGELESRRSAAYISGYLLRSGQDPASEPVALRDGWVFLLPDGTKISA